MYINLGRSTQSSVCASKGFGFLLINLKKKEKKCREDRNKREIDNNTTHKKRTTKGRQFIRGLLSPYFTLSSH